MERIGIKNRRILKGVLALVIMLSMFLGIKTNVSALDVFDNVWIYKEINKADGTTTPSTSFTYEISKKGYNDTTDTSKFTSIADVVINFDGSTDGIVQPNGTKTVMIGAGVVMPGVDNSAGASADTNFKNAGEYIYKIVEKSTTFVNSDRETITVSGAEYEMHV
ncbi:MAG: hypothetical protein ACK5LC_18515, partial [Coprobacillaceae bacterium]